MTENDILGFDPTSLNVFNKEENASNSQGNSQIYRIRPIDSKSEDKHYRCVIKPVYNPFNLKESILEQQSYGLQDGNGWFSVVSSLTVNDTSCPIFKAWKKCHFADAQSTLWKQAAKKEDGGNALFDKRFARYITIQILEDENRPDLVGKYMLWKLPKSIYDLIINKQNPSPESKKAPVPVMDFLFGRAIELEVVPGPGSPGDERYARETKYVGELSEDVVSIVSPDGSPLLNDADQAVLDEYVEEASKIWKCKDVEERAKLSEALNGSTVAAKLREIYGKVLNDVKGVCPDVIDVLGYKAWTPETTERVNKWIEVVLSGNNPASASEAPSAAATAGTPFVPAATTTGTKANDDLPFPTTSTATVETDGADDLPF